MERAGYGRRLLALSIDWAIASLSAGLVYPLQASALGPSLFRLGVFVLEVALLTSLGGASAGQRVMGIRVLSWPDNLFLRPGPILLRTILIALVIPAVVTDKDGRGLHDRAAKSVVMKVKQARA
ncbi:MAG: RDD family protein [Actinobacteria bacterium]|nr:RDD family protein [Actinomycetota bacterium]NDC81508.1 RDD family protein [Actinomycetota bacterium]NDD51183.1 RDD family protein [Actinomycetota bacterium]NDG68728.1 RDD family protein [Actinomycetota bacterium]